MTEHYNPGDIESKWRQYWQDNNIYKVSEDSSKPKFYCLDMFPYPSGVGLHVGHPRGYVASDVFSRFQRMQGFNVLHPMGWDSFGLPAEQYAIATGNHPGPFTDEQVARYRRQLDMIGLSYDWSREIATHKPEYYRWTQWIFLRLYEHYYDTVAGRALPITSLVSVFEVAGSAGVTAHHALHAEFSASEWSAMSELEQQNILMCYRLAYEGYAEVNWCSELGTVLANDEVLTDDDGRMVSERGGYPVERRSMRQWFMRITAYADRLITGLDTLDWEESIKAIQRNWIGKSEGVEIGFKIVIPPMGESDAAEHGPQDSSAPRNDTITVFTTRADTLFGVTYVVLAPDHPLVAELLPFVLNNDEVARYVEYVEARSEDDRVAAKEKTGVALNGVYAVNPANGERIPVWIADYVLGSYGTGAVMAVPAHDERDYDFARRHGLPIRHVVEALDVNTGPGNDAYREGIEIIERHNVVCIIESPDGSEYLCARWKQVDWRGFVTGGIEDGATLEDTVRTEVAEETGYIDIAEISVLGVSTHGLFYHVVKNQNRLAHYQIVHVKLASLVQQEVHADEQAIAEMVWVARDEVRNFLARMDMRYAWDVYTGSRGCVTMRGVVTHSGIYSGMRTEEVIKRMVVDGLGVARTTYRMRDAIFARQRYWGEPIPLRYSDGGMIHALSDTELPLVLPTLTEYLPTEEGDPPLARSKEWTHAGYEVNTMPGWAGSSWYWLRYMDPHNTERLASTDAIQYWQNVDLYVGGREHATGHLLYSRFWNKFLYDIGLAVTDEPFQKLRNQGMILAADGSKMSKRNPAGVVTPDEMIERFGADSFRLYQCFIGPFDASQPWIVDGLVGCRRFLERVWRIIGRTVSNPALDTDADSLRVLHKTIKKVGEDIAEFKFNTAVASLMECTNVLDKGTVSLDDARTLLILIAPFAPHMTEELYQNIQKQKQGESVRSINNDSWPAYNLDILVESTITIALSINGKARGELQIPIDASQSEVESLTRDTDVYRKWVGDTVPKKVIFVPNKIINFIL